MSHFWCQKFMNGTEAAPRENKLPAHLRVTAAHEAEQLNLLLGVRSEIGVPALGRHHAVAAGVPHQNGFAQASTSRKQRPSPARLRFSGIQNTKIVGRKMFEAV